MTDLRKAAEQALDAFEILDKRGGLGLDVHEYIRTKIEALRQALAQPEQEPVGYVTIENISSWAQVPSIKWLKKPTEGPLYTAPPKREWVGLTDDEVIKCFDSVAFGQVEDDLIINKHVNIFRAIHAIEAKLKEKNT